jgi:hypothetical protein
MWAVWQAVRRRAEARKKRVGEVIVRGLNCSRGASVELRDALRFRPPV